MPVVIKASRRRGEPSACHHFPDRPRQPGRVRHHHPAAAVLRADVRRLADDDRAALRVVLGRAALRVAAARPLVRHVGPPAGADPQPHRDRRELRDARRSRTAWRCSLRRGSWTGCRAATSPRRAPTSAISRPTRTARSISACSAPRSGWGSSSGPALAALFAHISYTAPIWAAAAITVVATLLAWLWLPETVHRVTATPARRGRRCASSARRPSLRLLFAIDFLYWASFAVYQIDVRAVRRAALRIRRGHTGYILAAFGVLGVIVQGAMVGPIVKRIGEKRVLVIGLVITAASWVGDRVGPLGAAVPGDARARRRSASASARRRWSRSSAARPAGTSRAACRAPPARSRASGRTIGPVWGNGALQVFGEGAAYASAARRAARHRGADDEIPAADGPAGGFSAGV